MTALSPLGNRRVLGAVVWGALLLGIIAMHGLETHGTGSHEAMGHSAVTATGAGTSDTVTHEESSQTGQVEIASASPSHSGLESGLVATCLAILGGLFLAIAIMLLGLLGRRPLGTAPREIRALPLVGRDRDPPCLVRLSVMRC